MRLWLVLACAVWAVSFYPPSAQGGPRPFPSDPELPEDVLTKLVASASEGTDKEQTARLRDVVVSALAADYKARAEQGREHTWRAGSLDAFWTWLESQKALHSELILAIHPRDDPAKVFGVVDHLHAEFPRETAKWPHLVIAYAVVWDCPTAGERTRDAVIWGKHQENAVPGAKMAESFRTVAATQSQLTFRSEQQRWPFLVYVADNEATVKDRMWALKQFRAKRSSLGPVYSRVPYDYEKLNRRPAQIGKNPTTLPNLLKYGGVCAEQAYFASRVCKTFGVPAAAVSGMGRYGGRHAWVGYFGVATSGGRARPAFRFHGRYRGDHYYVGTVLDPQTFTRITDRELNLLFDGAAQYADYERARLLWRVARWVDTKDPKLATRLLKASVTYNYYFGPAWHGLAGRVADGTIGGAESIGLLKAMLGRLKQHPDLTLAVLDKFLSAIPEDNVEARNRYYMRAYGLYRGRPDLQARLRLAQGKYLREHDRASAALKLMGATALANAKEAVYILPLAEEALDIFAAKQWYEKGARFAEALLSKMPSERLGRPAPAYLRFCKKTAEFCEQGGDTARARKWRDKAEELAGTRER